MSEQSLLQPSKPCFLYFADGSLFEGKLIGYESIAVGEVIFNTAMTGYQEIITDPSYASQLICFTYPHIGNTGINATDNESQSIFSSGIIIRNYPNHFSNYQAQKSLNDWLIDKKITGICDIDTREIAKMIRTKGSMNAVIYSQGNEKIAKEKLKKFSGLGGLDLAKEVSTAKSYQFNETLYEIDNPEKNLKQSNFKYKVAVLDFGVKHQILRILTSLQCELTVYPAQTNFETIAKQNFDGVFLSNGPGDPKPCTYAIELIKDLLKQKIPIFGICLGHQLLALALGAKTIKMKTGHHGANHPVECLKSGRVLITSQNHGFCVDENIDNAITITHRSLFDNTIQGIKHNTLPAYGFQGHPEASPGPTEARAIFNQFIDDMKKYQTMK